MKWGYYESQQVNGLVIKVGISRNSILIAGADAFGILMFIILVSIQMNWELKTFFFSSEESKLSVTTNNSLVATDR